MLQQKPAKTRRDVFCSTLAKTMISAFDRLPDELVESIIDAVDSDATLAALKQTCKRLDNLAERALCRTVNIAFPDPDNSQGLYGYTRPFVDSFNERNGRHELVRELNISLPSCCELVEWYASLPKLEVFRLACGQCECHDHDMLNCAGDRRWEWPVELIYHLQMLVARASVVCPPQARIWRCLRSCKDACDHIR